MTSQITQEYLLIAGQRIELPITIDALVALWGTPRLIKNNLDWLYIWDELGLSARSKVMGVLDQSLRGKYLHKLVIHLAHDDMPIQFQPAQVHSAQLSVEGRDILDLLNSTDVSDEDYFEVCVGIFSLTCDTPGADAISRVAVEREVHVAVFKQDASKCTPRVAKGEKLVFSDFNFKLAVLQELMFVQKIIQPVFNLRQFARHYALRKIDLDDEEGEIVSEVREYFERYEIDVSYAEKISVLDQLHGGEIYAEVIHCWHGEDETFNIRCFEDAKQFINLKTMHLFYYEDASILASARSMGIEIESGY
jgi:hypothetical protein